MDLSPFLQISGSETSLSNQTPSTLRGASLHHLLLLQNLHQHLPHPYGPPPFLRLGLNPDTATSALTFHLDPTTLRRFPEKPLILVEGRDVGGGVVGGGRGREREDGYMGGERVGVDFAKARGGGGMQPGELRGLVGE
ncbi:uncharacterized protein HKW66_Vig0043930 [Vigna angularis]|uniref:Uncharacterized protein n=1 Tax=Phaseolus angularis TaxID=3914 RepID=A0A8T0L228_PHAAN|nr:uncharacterized protein HKW66_Vig0043930 [Vigna angularis]